MYMTARSLAFIMSLKAADGTVVTPHKCITVCSSLLAIHKLFSLLQRDIHVAIDRLELPYHLVST